MTRTNPNNAASWIADKAQRNAIASKSMDYFIKCKVNILGCKNVAQIAVCGVMLDLYEMRYPTETTLIMCLRQLLQVQQDRLSIDFKSYQKL